MKKLILFSSLGIFFLLVAGTGLFYENIVGMASVDTETYSCMDTDDLANNPLDVKGIVTVTVSGVEKLLYSDYCSDKDTLHEYSCDDDTGKQTKSVHSCANFERTCNYGRCFLK